MCKYIRRLYINLTETHTYKYNCETNIEINIIYVVSDMPDSFYSLGVITGLGAVSSIKYRSHQF